MLEKLLPRSLSGRMTLILVLGLLVAQVASLLLHLQERSALMAAGHIHPGMPAFDALPLRFVWHVWLTLGAVILVSLVAVRWATRPLKRLADAANAFAHDLDAPSIAEQGPSEVRRAAQAFNFMQQRVRELVVERGRALAAVSHDLRTPLTRMRLRAELIDDQALQAKLNADIDAMQGMVNSVLTYLRGLEDDEPAQAIDMEALLSSLVEDGQSMGRPVHLKEPRRDAPRIEPFVGKLSLLRRATGNLIDNAVAHGRDVAVSLDVAPGHLDIVVEDDGPGIPPADLARVMEPYVRLDAARALDSGGVGLGLAIARDAAAYHGGLLTLSNREGGGLRAVLRLATRTE
ncbi:MAG: HAMP domain-containing protein [Rubrivivax sp.]|nr:HAMP domain-containing protein [Rubrivivax sp.]